MSRSTTGEEKVDYNDRYTLYGNSLIDCKQVEFWSRALAEGQILYFYGIIGLSKTDHANMIAESLEGATVHSYSYRDEGMMESVEQQLSDAIDSDGMHVFILRDLKFYDGKQLHQWLDTEVLRYDYTQKNIRFILIGMTELAPTFSIRVLQQEIIQIDARTFYLDTSTIQILFSLLRPSMQFTESQVLECFEMTFGYPLAVQSYLVNLPKRSTFLDLKKQIYADVVDVLSMEIKEYCYDLNMRTITLLSVYSSFSRHMSNDLLMGYSELSLDLAILRYPIFREAHNSISILPFLRLALLQQIDRYIPEAELVDFFQQAGDIAKKHGHFRQALDCYVLANNNEAVFESSLILFESNDLDTIRHLPVTAFDSTESLSKPDPRLLAAQVTLSYIHLKSTKANKILDQLKSKSSGERSGDLSDRPYTMYYLRALLASPGVLLEALDESFRIFLDLYADDDIREWITKDVVGREQLSPLYFVSNYQSEGSRFYANLMRNLNNDLRLSINLLLARFSLETGGRSSFHLYMSNIINDIGNMDHYDFKVLVDIEMAKMYMETGKPDKARELIRYLREEANWQGRDEIKYGAAALEAFIDLQENRLDNAMTWLEYDRRAREYPILSMDHPRYFLEAIIHMQLRNFDEAYAALMLIGPTIDSLTPSFSFIQNSIIRAILLYHTEGPWQEVLIPAVEVAEKCSLSQVFGDHGKALLPLWQKLKPTDTISAGFLRTVLLRLSQMAAYYPSYFHNLESERTNDALTDREHQILLSLRDGRTNKDIAEMQCISVSTVKFHIANIMRKLDASNRTDAVRKAYEYGLFQDRSQ